MGRMIINGEDGTKWGGWHLMVQVYTVGAFPGVHTHKQSYIHCVHS